MKVWVVRLELEGPAELLSRFAKTPASRQDPPQAGERAGAGRVKAHFGLILLGRLGKLALRFVKRLGPSAQAQRNRR